MTKPGPIAVADSTGEAGMVLVIEDDVDFSVLIEAALRAREIEHRVVHTLAEADQALSDHPFRVLLLDGLLPDGAGLEWLAKRREHGKTEMVILLSQHYREETSRPLLRQLDVTGVHAKATVDLDEVAREIAGLVTAVRAANPSES